MTVDIMETRGITQVVLKGDFDLYAATAARITIQDRMQAEGHRVIVDLSNVRYLDSSGVGALIRLIQHSRNRNGKILFSGIQGAPLKVLSMANILPLMTIIPTREQGITLLEKGNETTHG